MDTHANKGRHREHTVKETHVLKKLRVMLIITRREREKKMRNYIVTFAVKKEGKQTK